MAKALTTWSSLGATVTNSSNGWSFYGWNTSSTDVTRNYTDGQSVSNLTSTCGGTVNLYAMYSRSINFKSGASCGTSSTVTQVWTTYGTTNGTQLGGISSPSLTAITNWTAGGYRDDTTASTSEYAAGTTIYPATNSGTTLYSVYSRTLTFYSGLTKATTDGTRTQYLTCNSNTVTSVNSYSPATISGWNALGYRDDDSNTAGKEYDSGTSTSITPAYTTGNTMYAIYSRTLTFKSGVNKATTDGTKTQYLNTNSNTPNSVYSFEPAAITSWTPLGYRDDTTASTAEFSKGTSTSIRPAYNSGATLYAVYSRSYKAVFNSGVNKATKTTVTSSTSYYNSNAASTPASVSVTTETPVAVSDWLTSGWRDDTTTDTKEYNSATAYTVAWGTNFYGIYYRRCNSVFNSGVDRATKATVTSSTSYYNSNTSSTPTTVSIVTPTPAAVSSWTTLGWRTDGTASTQSANSGATVTVTCAAPFYGVYSRSYKAVFNSGVNKATKTTVTSSTSYYNSNSSSAPTTVNVKTPTAATNADITSWSELGYRADGTATSQAYNFNTTYSVAWGTNFYAVYSRQLEIAYRANGGTGSTSNTVKTIYLNSNSTTTSSQAVTLAANGYSYAGFRFNGWSIGSAGASYNPNLAYNASSFQVIANAQWLANNYQVLNASGGHVAYTTTFAQAVSASSANYSIKVLTETVVDNGATINKNLKLLLNACTLKLNTAISVTAGTFTVSGGGTLQRNSSNRLIETSGSGGLTVNGEAMILSGNGASLPIIYHAGSGALTVTGSSIISNTSTSGYSCIRGSGSGSITIDSSAVHNLSTGSYGWAIIADDNFTGKVTLKNGCEISNNSTTVRAVLIKSGSFEMSSGNVVGNAGAIRVGDPDGSIKSIPVTISGGIFNRTSQTQTTATAVFVRLSSTVNITGGSFTSASSATGPGISATSVGTFIVNGNNVDVSNTNTYWNSDGLYVTESLAYLVRGEFAAKNGRAIHATGSTATRVLVNQASGYGSGNSNSDGVRALSQANVAVYGEGSAIIRLGNQNYPTNSYAPTVFTGAASTYPFRCGSSNTCTFRGGRIFYVTADYIHYYVTVGTLTKNLSRDNTATVAGLSAAYKYLAYNTA